MTDAQRAITNPELTKDDVDVMIALVDNLEAADVPEEALHYTNKELSLTPEQIIAKILER